MPPSTYPQLMLLAEAIKIANETVKAASSENAMTPKVRSFLELSSAPIAICRGNKRSDIRIAQNKIQALGKISAERYNGTIKPKHVMNKCPIWTDNPV